MLEIIAIVLLILWALGVFVVPVGGAINILIVCVLVILLIRLLQGQKIL